ncbi:MAG: gamma-glutamyl-gamma-aminobutyrate hydrolase family protein [Candidatus Nitrospinota bacterium M3_3B_026]
MTKAKAPVIGVTADTSEDGASVMEGFGGRAVFWLKKSYTEAVEAAGGLPVIIPASGPPAKAARYLDMIDGLIISGGHFDIDPALYGEAPHPKTGPLKPARTAMEIKIFRAAVKRGMPVLGICGGAQVMSVAMGGSLYQSIPDQLEGAIPHEAPNPERPCHPARVDEGSLLGKIAGRESLSVNSTHHQGIKRPGRGFVACAVAPDGLIEAVEARRPGGFLLGVQWHPEALFETDEVSRRIFRRLAAESAKYGKGDRARD